MAENSRKNEFFERGSMAIIAIQVHHAVCDGYHVGQLIAILQEKIDSFSE